MDMVERVARALAGCDARWKIIRWQDVPGAVRAMFRADAKAAISAMLEGQEPVAWRYDDGEGSWELISDTSGPFAISLVSQGYSGTPLYDLSALKEVVG